MFWSAWQLIPVPFRINILMDACPGTVGHLTFARPYTLLTLLTLPFAGPPLRTVRGGATGPALITVLGQISRLQIAFGIAFTIGLALHA